MPARGRGDTAAAVSEAALPPQTLEGWYALHQVWRLDRPGIRALDPELRQELAAEARSTFAGLAGVQATSGSDTPAGWSTLVELTGSVGDLLVMHVRPTLDAVGDVQRRVAALQLSDYLEPVTAFLSVTEAGLYHMTAAVAAARVAAGGKAGDAEYYTELAARTAVERSNPYVQRRLFPPLPHDKPYVSFYPMSKRRDVAQNWYALPLSERSDLMHAHGATGRRYAGRVQQVITGAVGLDAWEWGVTLFAQDPLDIKRLVTDMRFDEVTAQYAEFGTFYVGRLIDIDAWLAHALP
jgi:peroxiredoxin